MDIGSDLERKSDENSGHGSEANSLLSILSQKDGIQLAQTDSNSEKARALDLLNQHMNPTGPATDCDQKPQLPSATFRPLQNTCGIDLVNAFEKVRQSTAKVIGPKQETFGSGFFACSTDKKLCALVTNDHVVKKASDHSDLTIYQEGVGVSKAAVIAVDEKNDLALLRIKPEQYPDQMFPATNLKPVQWAPSLHRNEAVFTVCSPSASTFSTFVSPGKVIHTDTVPAIINAPNSPRSIISSQKNFPGCSGGATFNKFGELVGVVRALNADSIVAIKARHALKFLNNEANPAGE